MLCLVGVFVSCLQIMQVFTSIGVSISDDVFQVLWKEAVSRDAEGKVCAYCSYYSTCTKHFAVWERHRESGICTLEMIHHPLLCPLLLPACSLQVSVESFRAVMEEAQSSQQTK